MTWNPSTVMPDVPRGKKIAVRIRGERIDEHSNWSAGEFDGWYLNGYLLHYGDGCGDCPLNGAPGRKKCRQETADGCPTTGFHAEADHPDYESYFLEARVTGWRLL